VYAVENWNIGQVDGQGKLHDRMVKAMSKMVVTTMRLTLRQEELARAVSRKLPGCPRPAKGSVAHCFKYWLLKYAEKNGIDIE